MDARVARQEAIEIVTTDPSRPETMLRFEGVYHEHHIIVRYIPDRYRLPKGSIKEYLKKLPEATWGDAEEVAYMILDDLGNQLVPKWLQVIVHFEQESAMIEERQPAWQNAALLSRQVVY